MVVLESKVKGGWWCVRESGGRQGCRVDLASPTKSKRKVNKTKSKSKSK
jgi:hypothetical protein